MHGNVSLTVGGSERAGQGDKEWGKANLAAGPKLARQRLEEVLCNLRLTILFKDGQQLHVHLLRVVELTRLFKLVHQRLAGAVQVLEVEPCYPNIELLLLLAEVDGLQGPLRHLPTPRP